MTPRRTGIARSAAVAALTASAFIVSAQGPQSTQGAAAAERTMRIYRCTDAAGHVTLQNDVRCPKGSREERRVVEVPPPAPAAASTGDPASGLVEGMPTVAVDAAASAASAAVSSPGAPPLAGPAPAAPPGPPGPPPALDACRTWDATDYLTEDAPPHERCAPLQVTDAGGTVRTDAAACEKVADTCAAIPADGLCAAWQQRVDEAEFRWKFAGAKDDARRREHESLVAKLARSNCAAH